jgi:hypothetical protein
VEAFSFAPLCLYIKSFPSQLFEERASALDCGGKAERRHRFPHETETPSIPKRRGAALPAALQNTFTNEDVYAFTSELEKLHPDNRSLRTARPCGRAPMRLPDTNLTN